MRWIASLIILLNLCVWSSAQQDDYTDKMDKEHQDDKPVTAPIAQGKTVAEIEAQDVVYATVGGQKVTGYLVRPKGNKKPLPGIIVIHEWWGLNDNIKAMARKLAAHGYVALAVDMYNGQVATTREKARELMRKASNDSDASEHNLKQAHKYLKENCRATRIGTIGWCFGGHWSLRTALLFPTKVDATVIYYGRLITDVEQLKPLQMPILGLFGELDRGIPVETVREFEKVLKSLDKKAQIEVYAGANHAFANPSGTRYNEKAATDAWQKTLAFFQNHLQK